MLSSHIAWEQVLQSYFDNYTWAHLCSLQVVVLHTTAVNLLQVISFQITSMCGI